MGWGWCCGCVCDSCVELLLALSREALLGSAGFFEGRLASFEVAGTLARLPYRRISLWESRDTQEQVTIVLT